ncbi:hypothetical protein ABZT51_32015 [Streptomyces sp. NPDC005373]|uniref:hypothetical protein n=1 Tax=Streptomyces sp. NPDC005373 TaxID=3156879 RepID=UPI0033B602F2
MHAEHQFEAWLYDMDEFADHRDGVRYRSTRTSRAEAMADLAHRRSMLGSIEDDLSPVLAVVADERFNRYGPGSSATRCDGTLEVYGVGILRAFAAPHRGAGSSTPTLPPSPGA